MYQSPSLFLRRITLISFTNQKLARACLHENGNISIQQYKNHEVILAWKCPPSQEEFENREQKEGLRLQSSIQVLWSILPEYIPVSMAWMRCQSIAGYPGPALKFSTTHLYTWVETQYNDASQGSNLGSSISSPAH